MTLSSRRQFFKQAGSVASYALMCQRGVGKAQSRTNPSPIQFASDKIVFCDWWFIEAGYGLRRDPSETTKDANRPKFMPYGVRLRSSKPFFSDRAIILPDSSADGSMLGAYSTLLNDKGIYRLWYETYQVAGQADEYAQICYAESEDGLTWKKPNLALFEHQGTTNNNLVYKHGHGATIFIDPAAKPGERYKMIHLDRVPPQLINGKLLDAFVFGAVSPDGIHWQRLPEPLLKHTSDTQSVAAYDVVTGKYVAYLRGWDPQTQAGYGGRRVVVRTESSTFGNFPEPEIVLALGPENPPDEDIYTSAYQQWPGAKQAHIMIPAIYHRASDRVDLQLALSHDGVRWHFPQGQPFICDGAPGSGYEGAIYAGCGTVKIANGMWAFPVSRYGRSHNMDFQPSKEHPREGSIWLAMLREDGFITLDAESDGEFWTQPAAFDGSRLLINCWGLTGARVAIELTDVQGKPFEGYSLADCDGLYGEHLWSPITWRGKSSVAAFRGKLVRIRFSLRRVRLYAFRFA